MEAARLGNREMIRLLVEYGADPNTTNEVSHTPLYPWPLSLSEMAPNCRRIGLH